MKNVPMRKENATFVAQDGKVTEYTAYFITVNGIDVKVKIADTTGKALVNAFLESK